MERSDLVELVAETGHIAEILRLLSVFPRRRTEKLGKVELLELASRTAGATYRYPNADPALKLAYALGLVQKSGSYVCLRETGKLLIQHNDRGNLDFNLHQSSILLGLLLDEPTMAELIAQVMRQLTQTSGGYLETTTNLGFWEESLLITAKLLQQLGVFVQHDSRLRLKAEFESLLPRNLLALSEEALWEKLEAQRIRAREAEEFALIQERKRLNALGRSDLAALVMRISAENVAIGYDIASFERDGSPRLIEVKSSIGRAVRFEWSVREREIAAKNKRRYWIYFVPLSTNLERRILPVLMLRDPISLIRSRKLLEVPSSYIVWTPNPRFSRRASSRSQAMVEWAG